MKKIVLDHLLIDITDEEFDKLKKLINNLNLGNSCDEHKSMVEFCDYCENLKEIYHNKAIKLDGIYRTYF